MQTPSSVKWLIARQLELRKALDALEREAKTRKLQRIERVRQRALASKLDALQRIWALHDLHFEIDFERLAVGRSKPTITARDAVLSILESHPRQWLGEPEILALLTGAARAEPSEKTVRRQTSQMRLGLDQLLLDGGASRRLSSAPAADIEWRASRPAQNLPKSKKADRGFD